MVRYAKFPNLSYALICNLYLHNSVSFIAPCHICHDDQLPFHILYSIFPIPAPPLQPVSFAYTYIGVSGVMKHFPFFIKWGLPTFILISGGVQISQVILLGDYNVV